MLTRFIDTDAVLYFMNAITFVLMSYVSGTYTRYGLPGSLAIAFKYQAYLISLPLLLLMFKELAFTDYLQTLAHLWYSTLYIPLVIAGAFIFKRKGLNRFNMLMMEDASDQEKSEMFLRFLAEKKRMESNNFALNVYGIIYAVTALSLLYFIFK